IGNGESLTASLPPGTHAITEVIPQGWDLTNIVCSGGSVTFTGAGGANATPAFEAGDTTVNVTATEGESGACTFTDTKRGSTRIVKQALGGDRGVAFSGDRDLVITTDGGFGVDATTFASISPGTYAVTELVPPGWVLVGLQCSNASVIDAATATARIDVAAGEGVICTFTDERQGSITVQKRLNGHTSATFGFTVPTTLDPRGTFSLTPPRSGAASRSFMNVSPGTYTITEALLPAGWILQGITCTGASTSVDFASRAATINLAPGDAATCLFDDVTLGTLTISV